MFDIFFLKNQHTLNLVVYSILSPINFSFLKISSSVTLLIIDKFKLKNYIQLKINKKRSSSYLQSACDETSCYYYYYYYYKRLCIMLMQLLYIYIYIYGEREREESVLQFIYKTMLQYLRANLKLREVLSLSLSLSLSLYIYIYIKKQFLFK